MFTGIIEEIGIVEKIEKDRDNLIFHIHCSFLEEIKINQSIAHNGICLTVTHLNENDYKMKNFSLVVPVFNEKDNLLILIEDIVNSGTYDSIDEIIFVNDCSTDGSHEILQKI